MNEMVDFLFVLIVMGVWLIWISVFGSRDVLVGYWWNLFFEIWVSIFGLFLFVMELIFFCDVLICLMVVCGFMLCKMGGLFVSDVMFILRVLF